MKKSFVLAAAVLVAGIAAVAMADPGYGRRGEGDCAKGDGPWSSFDANKIEKISGTVIALEPVRARRGNSQGIELKLNTGSGQVIVHVGPQWYLQKQTVKIVSGDAVEITGAKMVRRGAEIFIASEVRKGNDVLKLRNVNGVPAWRGERCKDGGKAPA
jgi:hypothetical protein